MAEPFVGIPVEMMVELLAMVPHWQCHILGPVPFGSGGERISYFGDFIIRPTKEEAEMVVWSHVQILCELENHPFVNEEWDIEYLVIAGGN